MSLGVLNNLSAIYAENNLNKTNASLNTVLQQLSSGSRINSGADDAAGLSLINGLQANSMALTQSQTNATEGVGLLTVADGALSQVTNLLNRAVTLATEASNGTLNASQDAAANQEYQSILAEITNIGSTTTYNQQAVFGKTTDIYTGDSSTLGSAITSLNIGGLSSSSVGDSGGVLSYSNGQNNVFINLSNGDTNANLTDRLNGSTSTITVNYVAKGAGGSMTPASAQISVGDGTSFDNTVGGLINAINGSGLGLSATFATQTQAGVQGGGMQTGIEITGGSISAGAAPSASSTSGLLNPDGIPANQLLTQGQIITVKQGSATAGTINIDASVKTLQDVANKINSWNGSDSPVAASVITNGDGTQSLSLANTRSTQGALTVSVAGGAAPALGVSTVAGAVSTDMKTPSNTVGGVAYVAAQKASATYGMAGINAGTDKISLDTQIQWTHNGVTDTLISGKGTDDAANHTYYSGNATDTLTSFAAAVSAKADNGVTGNVTAAGLQIQSKTVLGGDAVTISGANTTLSSANDTIGVYSPQLTDPSSFATAALQVDSGASIGATDNITGSVTIDTGGGAITFYQGTAGGPAADASHVYTGGYTLTDLENAINLASATLGLAASDGSGSGTGAIYLQSTTKGTTLTITSALSDASIAGHAMSAQGTQAGVAQVVGSNATTTIGAAGGKAVDSSDTIQGGITIANGSNTSIYKVGTGSNSAVPGTFYTNNTDGGGQNYGNTLAGLAAAIAANSGTTGVTALATNAGLQLTQTGSAGTFTGAALSTSSNTLTDLTKAQASTLTVGGFINESDTVAGSLKFEVGAGGVKTVTANQGETVGQLVDRINSDPNLGVSAAWDPNGSSGYGKIVLSATGVNPGNIVTNTTSSNLSSLTDTTATASLSYTAGSSYDVGISTSGSNKVFNATAGQTEASLVADQKEGSGVATISYSHGAGQSLSATSLATQAQAQDALTAINAAITAVSAQDGYIGAMINTLNAVSSVLATQSQNVTAAQNAVQATDYASAASNMSKYQILSQTGIAALSQANSMQREVTKLLQ